VDFSKNVIINQGIFHIFYCHHPGFCAIKKNLQSQAERVVDNNSLPLQPEVKNNLKGGMGVGVPINPKF
jgi:hypothetical protein